MTLTDEERVMLEELTRTGQAAARNSTHARILRKAAEGAGGPPWQDQQSSAALDVSAGTVRRIRHLCVDEGRADQGCLPPAVTGACVAQMAEVREV